MDSRREAPPPYFRSGQNLTAQQLNQIVRALHREIKIVAGPGIQVTQRGDKIVVSVVPGYEDRQLYRISAIRVSGTISTSTKGATVVARQDTITYDITPYRAVQRSAMTDVTPDLGRVEDDTLQIRSAAVGHPVWVYGLVRGEADERDLYVEVTSERIDLGTSCPEPA